MPKEQDNPHNKTTNTMFDSLMCAIMIQQSWNYQKPTYKFWRWEVNQVDGQRKFPWLDKMNTDRTGEQTRDWVNEQLNGSLVHTFTDKTNQNS